MVTPDVTPGCSRYTCVDSRGPYAHGVYNTAEGALAECFGMGFRNVRDSLPLASDANT